MADGLVLFVYRSIDGLISSSKLYSNTQNKEGLRNIVFSD